MEAAACCTWCRRVAQNLKPDAVQQARRVPQTAAYLTVAGDFFADLVGLSAFYSAYRSSLGGAEATPCSFNGDTGAFARIKRTLATMITEASIERNVTTSPAAK